jgi:hypothetical protein
VFSGFLFNPVFAMVDVMQDALANGQIVRPGEPGSLRAGISSEGKENAAEVNSAAIKGTKIVLHPTEKLKTC